MPGKIVFSNDYFEILSFPDGLYIETLKKGLSYDLMQSFFSLHPEIEVTNFNTLVKAVNSAPKFLEKFGRFKERISLNLTENDMKATIIFNLPDSELELSNRENLAKETMSLLAENGVVFGIKEDVLKEEIDKGKVYVIAEGIPPVDGSGAIVSMYSIQEAKPDVNENGTVDFYELKLINRVKTGDWLGEKIEPTRGIPGKSVRGADIKAMDGLNLPLNYDRETVMEVHDNRKTTLYSKIDGAVNITGGKITVSNHLEINGDIDFKTGNVNIDGYLTINGTVLDGFTVTATKDIEINSVLGLGNVKAIASIHGSIYIKGGIISKGRSEINAAKNIFTKFVDNGVIKAGGTVHIGYYCINSNIRAKEVIVDSLDGRLIGGNVKAEIRVVSPFIGSESEKKTFIEVVGFDRMALKKELDEAFQKVSELKNEMQKLMLTVTNLEEQRHIDSFLNMEYNDRTAKLTGIREQIKELEEKRKDIAGYLKTHGEGSVCISKKIYPNCTLIIKKHVIEIQQVTTAPTYFIQDDAVKQI